jgi:hypothetical protein
MANSVRQKIYTEVWTRLDAIVDGATYDTTPIIYGTWKDCWKSDATVAINVEYGDEDTDVAQWTLGAHGGGPVAVELIVNILVRGDGSDLMTLANSALQDVRNALLANLAGYKSTTGADFAALGTVTTDQGILSFEDKVLFTQPVVFKYNAGPTW